MTENPTYATPEEAALSGYSQGAHAFVVSVRMVDAWTAEVIVDTVPSHPVRSICFRDRDGRWEEAQSDG